MQVLTAMAVVSFMLFGILPATFADAAAPASGRGKTLYDNHCAECHGADGKGNGPGAASLSAKPVDFTSPKFWGNNAGKKIQNSIKNGHGAMPPVSLSQDDIKAVISYMTQTFKKQ